MKTQLLLTISLILAVAQEGRGDYLPSPLHFENGAFESSYITSPECQSIFDKSVYDVSHYLVGANRRTSVVHLKSKDETGFFHPMTLVGLLGYQNDFLNEREYQHKDGFIYKVRASGIVSRDFITMDLVIAKHSSEKEKPVCEAQATFSAFH